MLQILQSEKDPILRLNVSLELIELLLSCIALKDELQFDKRKRFYKTALAGKTGQKLANDIDTLLSLLGEISNIQFKNKTDEFLNIFENCSSCVL